MTIAGPVTLAGCSEAWTGTTEFREINELIEEDDDNNADIDEADDTGGTPIRKHFRPEGRNR